MRGHWNHTKPAQTQWRPADNTSSYINEQIATWLRMANSPVPAQAAQWLIHPESAMEVAAWWQAPSNPAITAFASTGTITDDLLGEIARERKAQQDWTTEAIELDAVKAYVEAVVEAARI